ncbi:hypothetical protein RFI_17529 [Reticulomyxa filosa]|uniref:PH domain-containing protein n=1 Tax=Reticulomyxa filosa TaxID=46433 RepID=X6N302_RETFI|nr:hypothetical protein RFI_17529 [Reticulomyxa filosa]|eukprot:ETO19697.1 hypothetical protein RFI_17529 [Reticulomyxa filosa]
MSMSRRGTIAASGVPPRDLIWSTKEIPTKVHASLWTQPPFTNEVQSPMFASATLTKPSLVYPKLNLNCMKVCTPECITVKVGWMNKAGAHVGSAVKNRYFILTSDKMLHYYENDECRQKKGEIDLRNMEKVALSSTRTDTLHIFTPQRKWDITCASQNEAIKWKETIFKLFCRICFIIIVVIIMCI